MCLLRRDDHGPVSGCQRHAETDEVLVTALDVTHYRQETHGVRVCHVTAELIHADPCGECQARLRRKQTLT